MKIEVLGTGCPKCQSLAKNAEQAASKMGIDYEVCKVTKLDEIMRRGVMMTPALAIDGKVESVGRVATEAEITTLLANRLNQAG